MTKNMTERDEKKRANSEEEEKGKEYFSNYFKACISYCSGE